MGRFASGSGSGPRLARPGAWAGSPKGEVSEARSSSAPARAPFPRRGEEGPLVLWAFPNWGTSAEACLSFEQHPVSPGCVEVAFCTCSVGLPGCCGRQLLGKICTWPRESEGVALGSKERKRKPSKTSQSSVRPRTWVRIPEPPSGVVFHFSGGVVTCSQLPCSWLVCRRCPCETGQLWFVEVNKSETV